MNIIKKLIEMFKNKNDDDSKSKKPVTVIAWVIIGVVILIAASSFWSGGSTQPAAPPSGGNSGAAAADTGQYVSDLEHRLENVLSGVQGVGKVSVMITLQNNGERVYASDSKSSLQNSSEADSGGGSKSSSQSDSQNTTIIYGQSGNQQPLVQKELLPAVEGVVVVAEGADDKDVNYALYETVKAALNVPAHRIQILTAKK